MLEVVLSGIADDDMVEVVGVVHVFHSVRFLASLDFESAKVRHFFETWNGYAQKSSFVNFSSEIFLQR